MIIIKYLLLGEIQQVIINHYNKYRQGLDFRDAATTLRSQNKVYEGTPINPDFLSWDTTQLDALKPLVGKIPVPLDVVLPIHPAFEPPVLINLEFYNPDSLKCMPHIIIMYVLSGSAVFYTATDSYPLESGSLLILSPELPHKLKCTTNDVVVNIISKPDLFEQHFSQILKKNDLLTTFFHQSLHQTQKDFLRFNLEPKQEILHIIKYLFMESVSTDPFATEVFLSYLQILYSYILRNCDTSYSNINFKHNNHLTVLPSILLYIQNEYRTITLSSLASHFNYASAYLSRMLKKETGKNFNDIVQELKINEAKLLLQFSTFSISDIAIQVGYNSSDHFTHSFKKETGMTPSRFRKENA